MSDDGVCEACGMTSWHQPNGIECATRERDRLRAALASAREERDGLGRSLELMVEARRRDAAERDAAREALKGLLSVLDSPPRPKAETEESFFDLLTREEVRMDKAVKAARAALADAATRKP